MKLPIKILSMIAITTMLVGCSNEVVKVDNITEQLRVVDLNYKEESTTTSAVLIGKIVRPITNHTPASYEVEFDYDGIKIKVDDETIYNKVKDKKYELVECQLSIEYYENGTYEIKILDIK